MPERSDSFEPGRAAELPELDTGTGWPGREPVATERPRVVVVDEDERPRSRSRGAGCLFWLAGVVALLVVLGLGAKVVGLWPHFHNPFASKQTDRSQPTLLLSIKDLSRFEAASGNFQVIID